jgi:hypothetical protein
MNSWVDITDTRNKHCLYRPDTNSSCFQKSTVSAGITVFNISPCNLTSLKNEKAESKLVLRWNLNTQPFYFVNEGLVCKVDA